MLLHNQVKGERPSKSGVMRLGLSLRYESLLYEGELDQKDWHGIVFELYGRIDKGGGLNFLFEGSS